MTLIRRRPARALTIGMSALVGAAMLGGAGVSAASASPSTPLGLFLYQGSPVDFTVPAGVSRVQITGVGGVGGDDESPSAYTDNGATVSGTLAVVANEHLRVSVGGRGSAPEKSKHDVPGGWGGMGANGGNGNGAKDTLRSSGGGGGATTVEAFLDGEWTPVLIAGGGGGQGGPSGDQVHDNYGGGAGWAKPDSCDADNSSWNGSDGQSGSALLGGGGGRAGAAAGMAGERGQGGHGLGGNGGGGGGGARGGAGGGGAKGTSSGGGGGAGSSANYLLTDASVQNSYCSPVAKRGMVDIAVAQ